LVGLLFFEQILVMVSKRQAPGWTASIEVMSWVLLVASCGFLLFSLIVYGLGGAYSDMGFIHPMRMRPPFADLRYLTANAECGVNLEDYYKGLVVGCDPSGRTYRFDYPPMSIWLGRVLHVRGSQTPWIAITTGLSLIMVIIALFKTFVVSAWKWRLIASATLMAFPVHQALERGNIDIILFLMMLLLAFLLARPMQRMPLALPATLVCCLLTFVSVSLKIYPLFGIVGLLAFRAKQAHLDHVIQWSHPVTKGLIIFAGAAGILPLLTYFRTVGNLIKEGGLGSHGLLAFGYMNSSLIDAFGFDMARVLIRLLFVTKVAAILFGFIMAHKAGLSTFRFNLDPSHRRWSGFLGVAIILASSTWMGCYILTINYDYRFIYLIPVLAYLLALASSPAGHLLQARWASALTVIMLILLLAQWLQFGYTDFGLKSLKIIEPISEFLLLPIFAGSLFYFLFTNTWLMPRSRRLQLR
jgi:hypothetical protein